MFTTATKLEDVFKNLTPTPLEDPREYKAFYCKELNELRGMDKIALLARGLERSYHANFFKALVMGHVGVGKSTELTRLEHLAEEQYRVIRFSADKCLDPLSFQPFDVLLLMMMEIVEHTAKPIEKGGAGQRPSEERLKEIWDWFSKEETTIKQTNATEVAAGAGMDTQGALWWGKALGLFAKLKGEIRFGNVREKERIEYRLNRLDTLVDIANRLIQECNQSLRDAARREWLFVGDGFEKDFIAARTEQLLVTYANFFKRLETHFIFTIPIALGYSQRANLLPVQRELVVCIPDTMIFDQKHDRHPKGREVLTKVVAARMDLALFAPDQLERLIVASGGNLRNLFSMINLACDLALVGGAKQLAASFVTSVIKDLRNDYLRLLGEDLYDRQTEEGKPRSEPITYEKKAARLLDIYAGKPTAKIFDPTLNSLLRSRAVQEFVNGDTWFGVHPLVVDILISQEKLKPAQGESIVPGGTT